MEINQFLVGAAYGDAITNEALRLRGLLRQTGTSDIYAYHRDPRLRGIFSLSDYKASPFADNLMIVYLSIGEPSFFSFVQARVGRILLRYHSMTPADEIRPYDADYAYLLELGREQVAGLASRTALALAGSRFSETELIPQGFGRTATCPLLMSVDVLHALPPRYPSEVPESGPLVLYVGRIVPNKAVEDALVAFHVLKTYCLPDARLVLVGGEQFESYQAMLTQLIADLGLTDVTFLGRVDAAELAALYRRATVLICVSRHEGFCAPLVEAMSFDLPIVAVDSTAVGETLGGAGLLVDERSPSLIAEALYSVATDSELREHLVELGRARLHDFAPDHVGAQWLTHVSSVL